MPAIYSSIVGLTMSIRRFLFHHEPQEFHWAARIPFMLVRSVWMVLEDFWINRGTQKSAALAYTSILSLFPLMAVLGIFATFFYKGGPREAENLVVGLMQRYILPAETITLGETPQPGSVPSADTTPENNIETMIRENFRQFRLKAGAIAGAGGFGLSLAAMALFTACEIFFNQIWKVQVRRSWTKRFSAFATSVISLPLVITVGAFATRFFKHQLDLLSQNPYVSDKALWLTSIMAAAAPFFFIWTAMTVAIVVVPNTRVKLMPAITGGLVAAVLWLVAKDAFFSSLGISEIRRSVFEAFGATLIFLVWMYFLWVVVLIGVETAYITQNFHFVLREHFKERQELLRDPRLYVLVLGRIVQSYYRGEGGIRFEELRKETNLRDSELEDILERLCKNHMVAAREDDRLIVERPPENLKLKEIFEIACCSTLLAGWSSNDDPLYGLLQKMDQAFPEQFGEITLKEILAQDGKLA